MIMKKQTRKNLTIKQIATIAVPILKKNGIVKAGIFGSYARGEAKKRSDIDILVKTKMGMSLLTFVGIKLELEKQLQRKVDLVEYDVIKQRIKEQILQEEVKII